VRSGAGSILLLYYYYYYYYYNDDCSYLRLDPLQKQKRMASETNAQRNKGAYWLLSNLSGVDKNPSEEREEQLEQGSGGKTPAPAVIKKDQKKLERKNEDEEEEKDDDDDDDDDDGYYNRMRKEPVAVFWSFKQGVYFSYRKR
jgi:hypothetical protein